MTIFQNTLSVRIPVHGNAYQKTKSGVTQILHSLDARYAQY